MAPRLLGEPLQEQSPDPLDLRDGVGALEDGEGGQRGREGAAREEEGAGEVDALGGARSASRASAADRAWPLAMALE